MSVSDDSAQRDKPNWSRIRHEYETTTIAQRALAKKCDVPYSTLAKRAMRQHWSQKAKLIQRTACLLESEMRAAEKQVIRDDLAPLLAKKREEITKRGISVAERGLSRVESLWDNSPPTESKAEAEGARAAETFLRMARTSAGMDGSGIAGALNLSILTNQAAIQFVAPG